MYGWLYNNQEKEKYFFFAAKNFIQILIFNFTRLAQYFLQKIETVRERRVRRWKPLAVSVAARRRLTSKKQSFGKGGFWWQRRWRPIISGDAGGSMVATPRATAARHDGGYLFMAVRRGCCWWFPTAEAAASGGLSLPGDDFQKLRLLIF